MDIQKIKFYMEKEILEKITVAAKRLSMDELRACLGDYYFMHSFDSDVVDINKVTNNLWRMYMEDGTSHLVSDEGLKVGINFYDVADYIYKLSDVANTSKEYNMHFRR